MVCDYITTGLGSWLVDLDSGPQKLRNSSCLQVGHCQLMDGQSTFMSTSFCSLIELLHQIKNLMQQKHTKAGAMKQKEAGYWLFKDDHVKKVRIHPGSGIKRHCSVLVQASFKSTTYYSTSQIEWFSDWCMLQVQGRSWRLLQKCCSFTVLHF